MKEVRFGLNFQGKTAHRKPKTLVIAAVNSKRKSTRTSNKSNSLQPLREFGSTGIRKFRKIPILIRFVSSRASAVN
jgi:hypothetical protein